MSVLLTGGLGYIGSHTCVELIKNGFDVVIVDNLSNSKIEVKDKLEKITNSKIKFYKKDLLNIEDLREIFKNESIDSCIHFAGLKAVGESVKVPLKYYENNIGTTINLLKVMKEFNCNNLVFSSSATVYGRAETMPIDENAPTGNTSNPYGRTKYFIEEILKDECNANKSLNVAILRYFNPIGAHESGIIGEDPNGIPNNLMPYVTKVAVGKLPILKVFGNDYDTSDGTGVRDYIHVCDLATGHVLALNKLKENCGLKIYNLGTGKGYSVLEIVNTFNKMYDGIVKYEFAPRRDGDIDVCYANPNKANKELNWYTKRDLSQMCKSAYEFEKNNK